MVRRHLAGARRGRRSPATHPLSPRLVTADVRILLPNGREYQNTEQDWTYLCSASLAARYLDLVPFDGLIDRRNDEPMIFAEHRPPGSDGFVRCDSRSRVRAIDEPEMPSLPWLHVDGLRGCGSRLHRRGVDREEHPERLAGAALPAARRQPRGRHRRAERDALARVGAALRRVWSAGADHLHLGLRSRRALHAEGGCPEGRVHDRQVRPRR